MPGWMRSALRGKQMVRPAQPPLVTNIITFGRLLRRAGLAVTPARTRLFLEAAAKVGVRSRDRLKYAGRAVFTGSPEERAVFDAAFDLFWRRSQAEGAPALNLPRITQRSRGRSIPDAGSRRDDSTPGVPVDATTTLGAGGAERLRQTDFQDLTPEELADAERMIAALQVKLPFRRTHRSVHQNRGRQLAVRASFRRTLSTGGELLNWRWSSRVKRARQIVIVADVSGSMERYTRLLLRFAHAVEHAGAPVEVFVFATRLTRITRELKHSRADVALAEVAEKVLDWSGGTRIGESIRELNRRWVRRVVHGGAVVLLISDGWERGDPALLGREMALLRRSCYRLVWLNPLAERPGYSPETVGLKAALPFVDLFLPCGNVRSLEALGKQLASRWGVCGRGSYNA